MSISFLHTMEGNVALFAHAAERAGWPPEVVRHEVRADLRQAIAEQQADPAAANGRVHEALRKLASESDAVVVTCATLGAAVDTFAASGVAVIRADAALAEAASRAGKKIAVLCAVESTIPANRALFEQYASATGATVAVRVVPAAWSLYQEGRHEECMAACAQAAKDARAQGFDVVAYAHPWMAAAAELDEENFRPLHSVQASLDAARASARAR